MRPAPLLQDVVLVLDMSLVFKAWLTAPSSGLILDVLLLLAFPDGVQQQPYMAADS